MSQSDNFSEWQKAKATAFIPASEEGSDNPTVITVEGILCDYLCEAVTEDEDGMSKSLAEAYIDLVTTLYQTGALNVEFFSRKFGSPLKECTLHANKPAVQEVKFLLQQAEEGGLPYKVLVKQYPIVRVMLDRGDLNITRELNVVLSKPR